MNEPTIPLSIAEMLCVTLEVAQQSGQLDARTQENLGIILDAYKARRDRHVRHEGFSANDVESCVAAAAESLANWLDDRAMKADLEDDEFAEFEKDFNERKAQDRDRNPAKRRQRTRTNHNRTGGSNTTAPSGGGWDSEGGATDPGFKGNLP